MGTWGPKLYEDDLAEDIKNEYEELLEKGKSNKEAIEDICQIYKEEIEDSDEKSVFWMVLADILYKHKDLTEFVKEKALKEIELGENLERWKNEGSEKDYIIKDVNLEEVVGKVLMNNKDDILEKNIEPQINIKNITVKSDKKWLEFIINQIVNNSIKYCKNIAMSHNDTKAVLKISATEEKEKVILSIYDNGMGIPNQDLKKIFEKSFTGENGRMGQKSTGMGLYIVKNLCSKLGHQVSAWSIQNEYTEIKIVFGKNDYYGF